MDIETPEFPKYVSPLINLANRYAQGTRPKIVGQMTELIKHFTGKELPEWEKWYLAQKLDAIRNATEKILQTVQNLRNSLATIDRAMIERWVRDLVIVKTFVGLRFQEAILKKGAELKVASCRFSTPVEESKGIDGFIGDESVSIKPATYELKPELSEQLPVKVIFYKKVKGGIEVDYGD